MGQWSRESFEKALGYFRLAVEKDPLTLWRMPIWRTVTECSGTGDIAPFWMHFKVPSRLRSMHWHSTTG